MTNKLGHVSDIDRRTSPGSPAWFARHTPPVRRLSALRTLHAVAGSHSAATGAIPGSLANASTPTLLAAARDQFGAKIQHTRKPR